MTSFETQPPSLVIPAQAGIHENPDKSSPHWIATYAAMTISLCSSVWAGATSPQPMMIAHEVHKPGVDDIASKDFKMDTAWLFEKADEKSRSDIEDPWEEFNRIVFSFNKTFVDGLFIRPAAALYEDTLHPTLKSGVNNFVSNAFTPLQTINHILQGDGERSFQSVFRFAINTTVGIFGLFDVAKEMGLENHPATLNHTFARWGVERGPYLMLPFFGPSCFRGAYGMAGDWFMNPLRFYVNNKHRHHNKHRQQRHLLQALYGIWIISERASLLDKVDEIYKSSDPYVEIRAYYAQKQTQIEEDLKKRQDGKSA